MRLNVEINGEPVVVEPIVDPELRLLIGACIIGGSVYNGHLHGAFQAQGQDMTVCLPNVEDGICYPGSLTCRDDAEELGEHFWGIWWNDSTPMAVG